MSPHHMMPGDSDAVKDVRLADGTARRVWAFARPYQKTIIVFLLAIVAAALLGLVPPFVVREIIDNAIPESDRGRITLLAAIAVGAALLDAALAILQRWCSAQVGEGLIFDLRSALFAKVQRLPIAFFTRTPTGAITSRLNNDVIGAQSAVTSTLGSVVSNVIVLSTTLAAMVALEWRLTLLTLIVLPLFIVPARRVGRRLQTIAREQMGHNAAMNTQMTERFNVSGAMLVKLFGSGTRERQSFDGRVFFVALGLVAAIGTAVIYGIGALLVVDGDITAGTLVALATLVTRVYQPLTGLTNARVDLMTSMVSFERVFEVLDAPEAITEKPGAVDLVDARGTIEFDDVVFRYPPASATAIRSMEQNAGLSIETDPDVDVLRGVSLTVDAGETVALVGASGAGKSTTIALISRLYDVTGGAVRIDGIDVRDLTLDSLRGAIGVVSQDPHLFHESIGENLRYADPDATNEQLVAAAKAARIHDTIAMLPDGYDTVVGERGYRLSGGEKQRLAIARLLIKNPAIMILDEATSHLDNDNEAHIQDALEHALEGRTAIVIAHRLSTIRSADRIAFIEGGRIVEIGTHDELVAAEGRYANQLAAGLLASND
jgi:ATP-binding cassette, subfamily B, bacterial